MKAWILAIAFAIAAGGAGAQEGVDVKRSGLRLLPASTVERSAAQQYSDLMRQAAQKNALNVDRRQVERLRNIARALIPQSTRFNQDAQRWLSLKNLNTVSGSASITTLRSSWCGNVLVMTAFAWSDVAAVAVRDVFVRTQPAP